MTFNEKQDVAMQQTVTQQCVRIAEGGSVQLALELAFLHGAQFVLADSIETMQKEYIIMNQQDRILAGITCVDRACGLCPRPEQ